MLPVIVHVLPPEFRERRLERGCGLRAAARLFDANFA